MLLKPASEAGLVLRVEADAEASAPAAAARMAEVVVNGWVPTGRVKGTLVALLPWVNQAAYGSCTDPVVASLLTTLH